MSHLPNPALFIVLGRLGFGAMSLLLPTTTLSLFRVNTPTPSPSAPLPTRLFGVREVALGLLLYNSRSPQSLRSLLIAGAVIDGIDCLSTIAGFEKGDIGRDGAVMMGGGAAVLLLSGVLALRSPMAAVKAVTR